MAIKHLYVIISMLIKLPCQASHMSIRNHSMKEDCDFGKLQVLRSNKGSVGDIPNLSSSSDCFSMLLVFLLDL